MKLDKLREERQGLPKRLEGFVEELKDLKTMLEAFGEDLERLRLQLSSIPIANIKRNWKCSLCGSPTS